MIKGVKKMTKKYYAVREGHQPGIYENWEECQAQVDGFSKAKFKSFKTWTEAEEYLEGVVIEEAGKEERSIEIERYDKPAEKEYTKGKTYNEIGADETGKEFYGPMVTVAVYYDDEFNQDLFDELDKLQSTDSKENSPKKIEEIALKLMDPANKLKFTIVEAIGEDSNSKQPDLYDARWDYNELYGQVNNANAVQAFMINHAIQLGIDQFGEPETITYDRFESDATYEDYLKGKGNHMNGKSIIDVIDSSRIIGVDATYQADAIKKSPSATASIIAKYVRNEFFKFVDEEYPVIGDNGKQMKMPQGDNPAERNIKYGQLFIAKYGLDKFKKFTKNNMTTYKKIVDSPKE